MYYLGCRNVQFDEPSITFFCDEYMKEGMADAGIDSEAVFGMYIDVYNRITKDRPLDLAVGIHMCRGNMKVRIYA